MNGELTIAKAALAGLFDLLGYPNPDDPGPWGPIGPVIRDQFWVSGPFLTSWHSKSGPLPDPWRSAWLARWAIDQAVAMGRSAEGAASEEQAASILSAARSSIRDFVDEFCGTIRPGKYPRPWPWPLGPWAPSSPLDLIMAGAQFQKAATGFHNPLTGNFANAADTLFETGWKRLSQAADQAEATKHNSVSSAG